MRAQPLGPSVDLPMGPRNVRGVRRQEVRRAEAGMGVGGGGRKEQGTRGAVCSQRRPNSTGWLGNR
eukprot:9184893-Pyramimonas_sp.AAC.1